jgi:DNA-binding transcriptional ArsR family regulator
VPRHPARVRILAHLERESASSTVLAQRLDAKRGTVSYHMRVLHRLELIELVREIPVYLFDALQMVEHTRVALERPAA